MGRRQEQLVSLLLRTEGWMTASALADSLWVTPRSVRSYIAQLNARSEPETAVESGASGYRAHRSVLAGLRGTVSPEADGTTPQDRLHTLVHQLLQAPAGLDIYRVAERMHVSAATLESDLVRLRELISGMDLTLQRSGPRIVLVGGELEQRRLVSTLAHAETERGFLNLRSLQRGARLQDVDPSSFTPFKRELTDGLVAAGFYVNELAAGDVILHVAIAAERAAQGRVVTAEPAESSEQMQQVATLLHRLAEKHLQVHFGAGDLHHLASLVLTRAVAPKGELTDVPLDTRIADVVDSAVRHAAEQYQVDIYYAAFLRRLTLHVQNLVQRAREQALSRNPLTRSLKSTYPMVFQVAVAICEQLGRELDLTLRDDEIAYVAMHVGGQLERSRRADTVLSATIICPGYYELHELLRSRIDQTLGSAVEVTAVETAIDPDWSAITTDLVLTTIEPPVPDERTVLLPPFLTDTDTERIAAAAGRRRRARRLARLRGELEHYFHPEAFIRPLQASDEEDAIRQLGAPLVASGVIDSDYIERAVQREQLSSTAFTEALAVPHALKMGAGRTAVSMGIAEHSLPWGESRVQFIALVAFSEEDHSAFQTIFEQLVEVFSERSSVQRILRRGATFTGFLDELAAVIDG